MDDYEIRVTITTEGGRMIAVAVWGIDFRGQLVMIDGWEPGPFDTRMDVLNRAFRSAMRQIPARSVQTS